MLLVIPIQLSNNPEPAPPVFFMAAILASKTLAVGGFPWRLLE